MALADEFGVNLRTVQRDLNVRFAYLPLQKNDGRYHLDPAYLGKLSTRDIERFAGLAGVRGLFPPLSDDFLGDIFDSRIQSALLVKGHNYEDLAGKEELFHDNLEARPEYADATFQPFLRVFFQLFSPTFRFSKTLSPLTFVASVAQTGRYHLSPA